MQTRLSAFYDILSVVIIFIFKLLLDISYVTVLYPNYSYAGFGLHYSLHSIIVGFILLLPIITFMPKKIEKPSDTLIFLMVVIMYVPLTTMFSFSGQVDFSTAVINMLFWLIVIAIIRFVPEFNIPDAGKFAPNWAIPAIFLLFLAYILITAVIYTDFDIIDSIVNFLDVYERRNAYKEANIPLSGYLYNWAGNVVFPCAGMYFLLKRNLPGVLTVVLAFLVSFAVTGFKSQMFGAALVILVYLLLKFKQRFLAASVILTVLVTASILINELFGNVVIYSLLVRRAMFLPVQIVQHYFDFFEGIPIFSSNSLLSSVVEYPYEIEPPYLIGTEFYIEGETHANTGIVADGFINFGYLGVVFWAVLFGFLMKLTDSVSKNKSFGLVLSCIAMFSVTFSNSALFTAFSTHGYMIALILIYLSPNEKCLFPNSKTKELL